MDAAGDRALSEVETPPTRRVPWMRYLAVYVVLFVVGTETFLVSPLLPTIARDVHVSQPAAARIVSAYALTYAVSAPFLGIVTDRFGRRRSILIGASLFLVGNLVAALSFQLGPLILARAIGGLGAALAGPAIWAYIGDTAAPEVRGRAMGAGMAAFSLGQVVGIPVGAFVAGLAGWHASFAFIAGLTLLSLIALYRQVRHTTLSPAAVNAGAFVRQVFTIWRYGTPSHALAVTLLLQCASLGSYAYLGALLAGRFSLSVGVLGLVGVLVGAGSVLGSMVGGRLRDRMRAKAGSDASLLVVWCLALGAGLVLAAQGGTVWLSVLGVLVWFFASGAFVTDQQTLLSNAAPTLRATASSWNTATLYVGTALGVWIIGTFTALPVGVTVVGGVLSVLAAVLGAALDLRIRRVAQAPAS